ncbi:MAG TPA: PTS sugar transporter subunit IIA [Longimicrobium sp.]|uniref:PTS sugar transporter subunit IIA n=1 Tax=Longimicrobium sp. TaxID=2029185 RepID=UPI002ED7F62F
MRLAVLLNELLTPERVRVPLRGASKQELLQELVAVLHDAGVVADSEGVLASVRQREELLSTGVGSGVAIPHGKSNSVPELVMAAGVTRGPVDFDALDGQPVHLVFLLVGPEAAAGQHVKALSRISRMVRRDGFRERLMAAQTAGEFVALLAEAESL